MNGETIHDRRPAPAADAGAAGTVQRYRTWLPPLVTAALCGAGFRPWTEPRTNGRDALHNLVKGRGGQAVLATVRVRWYPAVDPGLGHEVTVRFGCNAFTAERYRFLAVVEAGAFAEAARALEASLQRVEAPAP